MGACMSKNADGIPESAADVSPKTKEKAVEAEIQLLDFMLKKKKDECSGMFWRTDPTGKIQLNGGYNWPKDNATLRGVVVEHEGEKWLHAHKVKQEGSNNWLDVPQGAFMPFEHDHHYYLEAV